MSIKTLNFAFFKLSPYKLYDIIKRIKSRDIYKDNENYRLMKEELIKNKIRLIKDFPKEGVIYKDITLLLKDPITFRMIMNKFYERYKNIDIDMIVGIDSRGFIIGGALANMMGKGFVPARKKGKLPHEKISVHYNYEYSDATLEIHKDGINAGEKILIIDDQLATGGTCLAAINLVKKLGGDIVECAFIINVESLGGKKRINKEGHDVYSIVNLDK